jgi:sulfite exporter TauE/SafE
MTSFLTQGVLLGLAMGTTCLATCGPIYAPYLMEYNRGLNRSLLAVLEMSAGRFLAYGIFGLVAGYFGTKIAIAHRPIFTAVAYFLLSALLISSAIVTFRTEKLCAVNRWSKYVHRPFVLGIVTGINLGPAFLIALTKAVSLSGALAGMLFFMAFFVGNSVYIVPLSLFGIFGTRKTLRHIGRLAALGVGVWFLVSAVRMVV